MNRYFVTHQVYQDYNHSVVTKVVYLTLPLNVPLIISISTSTKRLNQLRPYLYSRTPFSTKESHVIFDLTHGGVEVS